LQDIQKTAANANSWVVGPGIGRGEFISKHLLEILGYFEGKLILLDADALWILHEEGKRAKGAKSLSAVLGEVAKKNTLVLTPNEIELARLLQAFVDEKSTPEEVREFGQSLYDYSAKDIYSRLSVEEAQSVAKHFDKVKKLMDGVGILLIKGQADIVFGRSVEVWRGQSGLKRCGGQGDVLGGLCSLYGYWAKEKGDVERGLIMACAVTREASSIAYSKYLWSLTAQKVIESLPEAIKTIFELSVEDQ